MLTAIFVFALGFFVKTQSVGAVTLQKVKVEGYAYTRYEHSVASGDFSDYYYKYYFNGNVAFCIEPGIHITSYEYVETNESSLNISADMIRRLTLITHYGYDYPGHQTDRYFVATQNLIWKTVANYSFITTSNLWGEGIVHDLSAEENEIMNMVNSHYTRPSFNNSTQELNIGDTITLTDTNGVLNGYEVSSASDNVRYSINGNQLTITTTSIGDSKIEFKRKNEDIRSTIIYKATNSQTMGHFGLTDPSMAFLNIKTKGGTLSINKTGEKLEYKDNSYVYNEIPLEGVKFDLYAEETIADNLGNVVFEKGAKVRTATSNENGLIYFGDLYLGKYSYQEVESANNNVVDNSKHYFEITLNNLNQEVKVKNYLAKGTLDFSKIDFSTSEPLPNTKIQIYTEDDILIYEGVTNEEGKIVIDNLPVGKFYLMEVEAPDGYILNPSKMYFEIKQNEIIRCTMTNEQVIKAEIPKTGVNDYSLVMYGIFGLLTLFTVKRLNEEN